MRFGILGPVQVWHAGGQRVPVGGPGVRALLARLLLDAGRLVSTGALIQDLYGEPAPAGAANALQSQVSRLRRTLPPEVAIEWQPAGYRLAIDPEQVDAHRFSRLAAAGRLALSGGEHARAIELLAEALGQWRGPALADVSDTPFAAAQIARLDAHWLATTEDLFETRLQLGDADGVVAGLQEVAAAHPLRERLHGQLLRALHLGGRPAEALAAFAKLRERLADELGADPSPELAALHVAILRGDPPADLPGSTGRHAAAGLSASANVTAQPLPSQLTPFLGRDEELARVSKLLAASRLVTLTGPGGTGKTRLAIEAAAGQPGERCFLDLAPLTDGSEVPWAALTALGLRDAALRAPTASGGPDPLARLAAALATRPMLIVLDNCEHVIADAAALAQRLLSACPQLRVLATSREPLGLTGEAMCPVPGLAVPPGDGPLAEVPEYPAAALLLDRAARAAPDRVPDQVPDDLAAVRRICRGLDGLPLAIELAAVRLRTLPVAEVAARLDDRFGLLSRGSRTAQPRHRTLRAVIAWSWELLDEAERALARRLTVFAGGATLAAIRRVCDGSDDVLSSLVDKSLVETAGGRYRMLETVRAYGAEELRAAGEAEQLRRAHAAYFLELAWGADREVRGAEQLTALAVLDAERDNLHAVLRAAVAARDARTALELVNALAFYWWLRGSRGEATGLAAEALAIADGAPPPEMKDEFALCQLLASLGSADDAGRAQRLRTAANLAFELVRQPRQPFLFYLSSMVAGPPEGGAEKVREMIVRTEHAIGLDPWTRALSPVGMAMVLAIDGDLVGAEREAKLSLARFRALGERWGTLTALGALGEIAAERGEAARAVELMGEALALAGALNSLVDIADLLRMRAGIHRRAGDIPAAAQDYQQVVEVARGAGAPELIAAGYLGLALVARHRGNLPEARRLAERALAQCPTGWFTADEIRADIQRLIMSF